MGGDREHPRDRKGRLPSASGGTRGAHADIEDELSFHLERRVEDLVREGLPEAEARERARREFGDVAKIRRDLSRLERRRSRGRALGELAGDVGLGLRALRRQPGFAAAMLATLALVIGATTTIAGLVNGVLLRPLPYPESERIAVVWEHNVARGIGENVASVPAFEEWARTSESFGPLAALVPHTATLSEGSVERERGGEVSPAWFDVVGVAPALGRAFEEADPADVVLLSHGMWADRFGSDPDIVGRRIRLGAEPRTVLGVMPEGFAPPAFGWLGSTQRYWVPFVPDDDNRSWGRFLLVFGRLASGATVAQADQEMKSIAARRARDDAALEEWTVDVVTLHEQVTGDVRAPLLVLLTAVGFLLAIGLLNATNLVLARSQRRSGELAVRAALGAGRTRIARQLVGEALAIALVAGPLGMLLAWLGVAGLRALLPASVPRSTDVRLDAAALAVAVAAAALTALATGLVPALRAGLRDIDTRLRSAGSSRTTGRGGGRALVVAEVALALVMAVGAGLSARSLAKLRAVPLGFEPEQVVAFRLTLPSDRYAEDERRAFFAQLFASLEAQPGIESAGATTGRPITGWGPATRVARFGEALGGGAAQVTDIRVFTPGYFESLRVGRVAGNLSGAGSGRGSRRGGTTPVVVNESMVRALWPDRDPIGQAAEVSFGTPDTVVVAGVVADVPMADPAQRARPTLYYPYADWSETSMDVVVRADLPAAAVVDAARRGVAELDASLPIYDVAVLESTVADATAEERVQSTLLAGFALLAVLLAAVGIYGVLALEVGRRRRELAVRLALGAAPARVRGTVVRDALALTGAGLAIGTAVALLLTRFMASLLYGIEPDDPLTFAGVAGLLLIVAVAAAWPSAHRAATVSPMESMRVE